MINFSNKRKVMVIFIFTLIIILIPSLIFISSGSYSNDQEIMNLKSSRTEYSQALWMDNPNFTDTANPWFSSIDGDSTDVSSSYSPNQANFEISGDKRYFNEISGTPIEEEWQNTTNPFFPALPDFHEIDEYGCEVSHTWIDPDDPIQTPSIHWERNITMPVNMSEYRITSASISAVYNASVTTSPGGAGSPNDYYGVDSKNDPVDQPGDYDTARFYVQISDLEDNEIYEIGWYQTVDLGQDDPEIANISDSFMNVVVEEALIFYLGSLFERDNFNFKITLGIRIKCIDNFNYDRDRWDSLRIKSCNLNFTYEKIINQFTSVSWKQEGNTISGDNVFITDANLKFKHKINETWPEILSPSSELRILVNNNSHTETINLNLLNANFQEAKVEGFDITYLILKDINITLSIQLYIADEFLFNRSIMVSIDEVFLEIFYYTVFTEFLSEPEIFQTLMALALIAAAAIGTYFILYQRILKYPLPVRKVRKYRRTLDNTDAPSTSIMDSSTSFNKAYQAESKGSTKFLNLKSISTSGKSSGEISKIKPIGSKGGEI
jgi:hypothetical protein